MTSAVMSAVLPATHPLLPRGHAAPDRLITTTRPSTTEENL